MEPLPTYAEATSTTPLVEEREDRCTRIIIVCMIVIVILVLIMI